MQMLSIYDGPTWLEECVFKWRDIGVVAAR